jgi:hypothetical protein
MPARELENRLLQGTGPRLAGPTRDSLEGAGPLANLIGTWEGHGFNAIWRPHFPGGSSDPFDPPFNSLPQGDPPDHFLMLNLTHERTHFGLVSTTVPNRGGGETDINIMVLHYLQQISDANSSPGLGAIHFEPGLWAYVPGTTDTASQSTVNRMASIPHGNALLAEGLATTISTPDIQPINIEPFPIGDPTQQLGNPPFIDLDLTNAPLISRNDPLPAGSVDPTVALQDLVDNPNALLTEELTHLEHDLGLSVVETTKLAIATTPDAGAHTGGGIESIPFLNATSSADIPSMSATFWISELKSTSPHAKRMLLLQYSQTVLLNFATLSWPHVTVANLFKKF